MSFFDAAYKKGWQCLKLSAHFTFHKITELFGYYVRMCILIYTMWQGVDLLPAALHGSQGLHLVRLYAPT